MIAAMAAHMSDISSTEIRSVERQKADYVPRALRLPAFMEQAA
jgi:hypothetical protein